MSASWIPSARYRRETLLNWLSLLVLLSLGCAFSGCYAATPYEEQSGTLLMKPSADASPVEALRVASSFRVQVTGNLARVYVTQQFSNSSDDWMEGLYVFPLSVGAAVDELEMHVGDRVIRGEIQQRSKARVTYEQARTEGRQASLVEQERPNMFSTAVANIAPHAAISIELAYLETIALRDGRYTLHLPLAIVPRYNPAFGLDPATANAAQLIREANATLGVTNTPERVTSAQQKVSIEVELSPGFRLQSLQSLHHEVTSTDDGTAQQIRLTASQVPADRDFELVWTPAVVPAVQASAFTEQFGSESYALLMLTAPQNTGRSAQRREVQFIIDTSGSMYGPSIEQARAALQMGVDRLTAEDRFNIIRFSSDASSLFQGPQAVSAASRAQATHFIHALQASGGTEMRAPLELAFSTAPEEGWLRQIVFITDGGVSNEAEIVDLIRKRIGTGRLFTVGIGGSPNTYFMQEAAAAGRGSYTLIADRAQVQERMESLFEKIEHPALVDLHVQWPGSAAAELAASLPGDLYAGDPLIVVARVPASLTGKQLVTLSAQCDGSPWVQQLPVVSVSAQAGIAKLWARERISSLSREKNFGGAAAEAEASITSLALRYHLVSEYTSLVAVDALPVRPAGTPDRSAQAPVSAPAGSYWANTTGFAQTGTDSRLLLTLGLAA
ncbi:MAG: marine proteobacterial sortase target protein, partial [Sinobacteraceae bacterium]|nr:marine proteobacterial sortase target protein [Nevskiaceae bacterium]